MTSSNLTKGTRASTINNLNKVLSDVKSFRDDFDPEQLEAMRQTAAKIMELCEFRSAIDEVGFDTNNYTPKEQADFLYGKEG